MDPVEYAKIPIAFESHSRLDLAVLRDGRFLEIPIEPFTKDYDRFESPADLPQRFDTTNWLWLQKENAGAIVAWNTPGVDMLEGRDDLAVLWDIRIAPEARGQGLGRLLVNEAIAWAKERGCRELKVETQDNNVAACRFYAAMGLRLDSITPDAYPGLNEAMLIWRMPLT